MSQSAGALARSLHNEIGLVEHAQELSADLLERARTTLHLFVLSLVNAPRRSNWVPFRRLRLDHLGAEVRNYLAAPARTNPGSYFNHYDIAERLPH